MERSFAHVCDTGGSRRSWLRGFQKVRKRYSIAAAARNLGLVMRAVFGFGKPRVLQVGLAAVGVAAARLLAGSSLSPSRYRTKISYAVGT